MQPVLSIQGISKRYGSIQALNNVSFDVPQGCVFGILGPNGSGKTTMLSIFWIFCKPIRAIMHGLENPALRKPENRLAHFLRPLISIIIFLL
jgi:ABC-type multidrug transport system ATPase subunit